MRDSTMRERRSANLCVVALHNPNQSHLACSSETEYTGADSRLTDFSTYALGSPTDCIVMPAQAGIQL